MHTHHSVMSTAVGGAIWEGIGADSLVLGTAPMFHVTGMQHSMNAPIFAGATIAHPPALGPRSGRLHDRALRLHTLAECADHGGGPAAHPATEGRDLSSLQNIFGGGASMPEAVAQKLFELCGIEYMEGYGMTETISQTHMNPPGHLRKQCLGIPTFDTESLMIDPETLRPVAPGQPGEIVSHGPQVFKGYWNESQATAAALIEIGARRSCAPATSATTTRTATSTSPIGLKRMINASGYKVWPAEVEMALYGHPDIQEVAIVSAPDARRGETVKAFVVLKPGPKVASRPSRSSTGHACIWRRTRCRGWSNSWRRCRARARARSSGGCCRSRNGKNPRQTPRNPQNAMTMKGVTVIAQFRKIYNASNCNPAPAVWSRSDDHISRRVSG